MVELAQLDGGQRRQRTVGGQGVDGDDHPGPPGLRSSQPLSEDVLGGAVHLVGAEDDDEAVVGQLGRPQCAQHRIGDGGRVLDARGAEGGEQDVDAGIVGAGLGAVVVHAEDRALPARFEGSEESGLAEADATDDGRGRMAIEQGLEMVGVWGGDCGDVHEVHPRDLRDRSLGGHYGMFFGHYSTRGARARAVTTRSSCDVDCVTFGDYSNHVPVVLRYSLGAGRHAR